MIVYSISLLGSGVVHGRGELSCPFHCIHIEVVVALNNVSGF